jgi:DNA repair exonuclease SbcCD ATPase subunit
MEEFNRIEFKWIKVKNFLSIKDEMLFDFTKHHGMNYIFGNNRDIKDGGRNGVGKSAIFCDAILFALFGKTSKKINKHNVINRIAKKACLITIEFSINSDDYIIESGIKPTFVSLFKNGENVTKSTIKETRDFIETEILKSTFSIFKNSIILSVNDSSSIFEMNAYQKREFIERIFNLTIFGQMFHNVRRDILVVDKEITEEQTKYTRLEKSLKEFKDKLKTFNTDKNKNIKEIATKIRNLQSQIKTLKTDNSKYSASLIKLNSEIEKLLNAKHTKSTDLTEITSKISYMNKELASKKRVLNKYEKIYDLVGNCCKPLLDKELDFTKNKNAIDKIISDIETTNQDMEKSKVIINKIDDKLNQLKKNQQQLEKSINDVENNKNTKNIYSSKMEILKEQAIETKNKVSPFKDLIETYTEDKKDTYKKLSTKMDQRRYLDFCEFVLSPDGVKKWIISNLINTLNTRITRYLEEMGAEYTVVFDPDFSCRFLTTTGECDYHNFSSGEKMRVNHAATFAFRDILAGQGTLSSSILVCDEICDVSVDSVCIQALFEILKRESQHQTIYLISHREELSKKDEIDNLIEIVKENGTTKIISDPMADN